VREVRAALCALLLCAPAAAAAAEPPAPPPQRSLGASLGALFPFDPDVSTQPRLALQLSGPLPLRAPAAGRVEWLATAAFRFSGQEREDFERRSERSTLGLELMPGARALLPVHARLDLSAELSAGLSLVRVRASTRTGAGSEALQQTQWGAVGRLALGGQVPLEERLRLYVEPVAVQTWLDSTGVRAAWSMQFGLAWAL
jgi:hypothetical protein